MVLENVLHFLECTETAGCQHSGFKRHSRAFNITTDLDYRWKEIPMSQIGDQSGVICACTQGQSSH